ncbi:porin family protein [Leadbetterella byssophila]|uniref:Outer membrane protein beta-barrel domain-containing protein n=1 Tax=Leadbetterella byssophila (strain DSM 17132 / JCM 16389 / KACC 11308 / NBRC 106382 / 4M15) TaxID=649349 RepID=E4RZS5_LEAB4|nr:porin family protein [Leadbetterella byssophila]ADQ19217.1 hypothetical protein Lbys_3569 [Leadbetterella byssophila DSM 17132]
MHIARVLVLLLLTLPAAAQIEPRLFEFGPKLGLNLSNVSPSDTVTYSKKPTFGVQAGFFTRLNVGKFSLQPEFIYQAKGTSMSRPISAKHTYRYFSTPVLLGYTAIKHVYFEVGYERNWALNRMETIPTLNKPYGPGKKDDQSLIIGARVNLLDMFSLFSLNLRYVHGLNNVSELKSGNIPLEFANRSIQISATYTFSEQYLWNKKFGVKKK